MFNKTHDERIRVGREAKYRLEDEFLNTALDDLTNVYLARMLDAPLTDQPAILAAKASLNALLDVRKNLRSLMVDGELATKELDHNG